MASLPIAPPPWTCTCIAHLLPFYANPSTALPLHLAYDPLESRSASFSFPTQAGPHHGGLAFAQIIRYTDTPVGPYDELALLPGSFGVPPGGLKGEDGKPAAVKKEMRITGIWVSSAATLVNGRRNWNIPKHMARFAFTALPGAGKGVTKVEVFPPVEGKDVKPFFTAVIHPISYMPNLPFDTDWMGYLGFSTHMLQPPLPAGEDEGLEIGTEDWKRAKVRMKCGKAKFVWIDMRQSGKRGGDGMGGERNGEVEGEGEGVISREHREEEGWENWWPGMRRWHLGLECQGAVLELEEPEILVKKGD